jgi:hypothetical protein
MINFLLERELSALIHNSGDVSAEKFFHLRDTVFDPEAQTRREDTETLFLFAHRETTMGKKLEPSVRASLHIET